jgi:hypothetical protein
MRNIVVTQINWNGQGSDRAFSYWVKRDQVALKIRDLERSYNMDHTTIEII